MRDWPFKVTTDGIRPGEVLTVGSRQTGKSMLAEEITRAAGAHKVLVSLEMKPTLPRFNDPVKRVTMDPEEPNTCEECGARTELVDHGPWGEYMIERCPACGQLHHFYPPEED